MMTRETTILAAAAMGLLAAPAPAGDPVPYLLGDDARYEHGCYEPCMCPIMMGDLSGSFTLMPVSITGTLDEYVVEDVDWTVTFIGGAPSLHVTGSGTFTRFQEFAVTQTLELDLSIDGGPAEHFTSGTVVVPGYEFPDIDMAVAMNDFYCLDTAFFVDASPAPPSVACEGDVNGDGQVNFADVLAVIGSWGPCNGVCPADVDDNGNVGFNDMLMVIGAWGACP
ncbi:MAG: hypothetical protein ACYTGP_06490 [Planctomycetota bacterium]